MLEAIRNRDYSFRLPMQGLAEGERILQDTLNQFGGGEGFFVEAYISWEQLGFDGVVMTDDLAMAAVGCLISFVISFAVSYVLGVDENK